MNADEEIRQALKAAGLEHMEDDVLLECGLIEATAVAETVIQKHKEAKDGKTKDHLPHQRECK